MFSNGSSGDNPPTRIYTPSRRKTEIKTFIYCRSLNFASLIFAAPFIRGTLISRNFLNHENREN